MQAYRVTRSRTYVDRHLIWFYAAGEREDLLRLAYPFH